MNCRIVIFFSATLLFSACCGQVAANNEDAAAKAPVSGQSTVSESVAMDENKPQGAGAALQAVLQAGMAYADFRKQVVAQGWTPVADVQCEVNVVGENHEAVCSQAPNLATCKICDEMTELSACSADGRCLVRFRNDASGEILEATGYGMIEDWSVSGEDSRLQLSRWSSSKDSFP